MNPIIVTPETLCDCARALCEGEHDLICNLANLSALIMQTLPDLNWVGFYLLKEKELVLGPFQGRPACTRIPLGKGVCGTAAQKRKILNVADVHQFPGHIACDAQSRSELVVPLLCHGQLVGVLDIDAPVLNRFHSKEEAILKQLGGWIATLFEKKRKN